MNRSGVQMHMQRRKCFHLISVFKDKANGLYCKSNRCHELSTCYYVKNMYMGYCIIIVEYKMNYDRIQAEKVHDLLLIYNMVQPTKISIMFLSNVSSGLHAHMLMCIQHLWIICSKVYTVSITIIRRTHTMSWMVFPQFFDRYQQPWSYIW